MRGVDGILGIRSGERMVERMVEEMGFGKVIMRGVRSTDFLDLGGWRKI
jgi:hypothetical protein